MENIVMNFLAYALVFIIVGTLAVTASLIGIKWRKAKDAKAGFRD